MNTYEVMIGNLQEELKTAWARIHELERELKKEKEGHQQTAKQFVDADVHAKYLEGQLERWKDEFCKMTEIRDHFVDELRRVKVELDNVGYAIRNVRHSILPER